MPKKLRDQTQESHSKWLF